VSQSAKPGAAEKVSRLTSWMERLSIRFKALWLISPVFSLGIVLLGGFFLTHCGPSGPPGLPDFEDPKLLRVIADYEKYAITSKVIPFGPHKELHKFAGSYTAYITPKATGLWSEFFAMIDESPILNRLAFTMGPVQGEPILLFNVGFEAIGPADRSLVFKRFTALVEANLIHPESDLRITDVRENMRLMVASLVAPEDAAWEIRIHVISPPPWSSSQTVKLVCYTAAPTSYPYAMPKERDRASLTNNWGKAVSAINRAVSDAAAKLNLSATSKCPLSMQLGANVWITPPYKFCEFIPNPRLSQTEIPQAVSAFVSALMSKVGESAQVVPSSFAEPYNACQILFKSLILPNVTWCMRVHLISPDYWSPTSELRLSAYSITPILVDGSAANIPGTQSSMKEIELYYRSVTDAVTAVAEGNKDIILIYPR
jgi:hypothetical protein